MDRSFFRWNKDAGVRAEYPVRVLFREVVAVSKDRQTKEWKANSRWSKAPVQMLTKCTEAAGLREAFPDEIGGEQTMEEMDGQRAIDVQVSTVEEKAQPEPPAGYFEWMDDLNAVADEGIDKLEDAYAKSAQEFRDFLSASNPSAWDALKARAMQHGASA